MFSARLSQVFMDLIKRLFPAVPLSSVTALSMEELAAKYRRLDRIGNFIGFGCYLAVAGVLFGVFTLIGRLGSHSLEPVQIPPGKTALPICMALLLSLFLSLPVLLLWVVPLVAGDKAREYMAYGANKLGYDPRKAALRIFLPIGLLALPPLCLACDYYDAFGEKAIYINGYWTLGSEVERPYTEVYAVLQVDGYKDRRGEFHRAPHYVIRFRDGDTMQTAKSASSSKEPTPALRKIADFVSKRSRKPIGRLKTYDVDDERRGR